jgi:hypothetical protein
MSISSTTTIRPQGRRAAIGIDSDASTGADGGGRVATGPVSGRARCAELTGTTVPGTAGANAGGGVGVGERSAAMGGGAPPGSTGGTADNAPRAIAATDRLLGGCWLPTGVARGGTGGDRGGGVIGAMEGALGP